VVSFGDGFADALEHLDVVLNRSEDPGLDELELGHDGVLELLHVGFVGRDVLDRLHGRRVLAFEIVFGPHGREEGRKGHAKVVGRVEHACQPVQRTLNLVKGMDAPTTESR
jgi:hypothetical protein